MKNSEWFWLAVCASCFLIGVLSWGYAYVYNTSPAQGLAHTMIGIILLAYSVIYFFANLAKPFNNWLDNLK